MKRVMENDLKKVSNFDDIVFETRNKEYGAYILRKKYNHNVVMSLLTGTMVMATVIITPFINMKALESRLKRTERQVEIKMENLDQPNQIVVPPPPLPPPADVVNQARYVPPVIVDSIKPDEAVALMTADQAQSEIKNEDVVEVIEKATEEVQEDETVAEPFVVVEEMPMFPGGNTELLKWISEHLQYPVIAQENNIQGKVFVKFSVTATGGVDRVTVSKGVDPELDAEAIRVVKLLPQFKPGKQGGKPVPVWYSVPIIFQIRN